MHNYNKLRSSILLFTCIGITHATPPISIKDDSPKEQYLQTIDYVAKMAQDIYCYWDIKKEQHGVDWQVIVNDAKNKVNDNTTFDQFQRILTSVASSLHDGHVNYIPASLQEIFYTPIRVKKLPDGYYISQVEQDKMWPYSIDIEPGDEVLAVHDQPIEAYITEKGKMMSASTMYALKSRTASAIHAMDKFQHAPKDNLKLTIKKYTTQQVKIVELPWINYQNPSSDEQSLSDIVQTKILPGNIGVLTLTSMHYKSGNEAHIAFIKQAMNTLKNTKSLIIDVRNNGGGYGEIGDSVVAHFINKKVRRYQAQLKNSYQAMYARPELIELFQQTDPSISEFSEWVDYDIQPLSAEKPAYDKPVYILTNERCFSACDTFVDSFSSNHLGKVLGARTGGGTGYPLWFKLPWQFGNFRFSILRGFSNHDRYLEGIGTIPDVEIYNTPRDLYHKLDGELIGAYNLVMNELNHTNQVQYAKKKIDLKTNFAMRQNEIVPFYIEEAYWQKVQR
ncbi:S41 family peptidase [Legionella gresilensis]|uniref:S41 family peptidase n=1 Tax=Legionella gresilensis TaxID=91823 RepID=UPI0010414CF1|nr:S41 family peptidase [Legionella gresilensis]